MAFGYIMLLVILIMPLMMVGFGLLLMKNPPKKKLLLWIQDEKICEESGNLGFCALLFRETVACVWPGESPDLSCSVMPGARKKRASDQCGGINRFGHSDASVAGYNTPGRKGINENFDEFGKPL